MAIDLVSIKFFNENRNGNLFDQNTGDFTTVLKGNAGERMKGVLQVNISWNVIALPFTIPVSGGLPTVTAGEITFDLRAITGVNKFSITASGGDFEEARFRKNDTFDFKDIGTATDYLNNTLDLINGNYIEFTAVAPIPVQIYLDAEIRGTTDLNTLDYRFNTPPRSNSGDLIDEYLGVQKGYKYSALTSGGGFQTGVPITPILGNSGTSQAKKEANIGLYTQVFEIENIFIIPYFKDGELVNLITQNIPEPFRSDTLFYTDQWTLGRNNIDASNREFIYSRALNDSFGYYNENFDAGVRDYSVVTRILVNSDGDEVEVLEVTDVTTVTVVIASLNGKEFVTTDPATLIHSYLPTENVSKSSIENVIDTNLYESLRTLIDAGGTSSDIIKNYTVIRDNATQITVTFDIDLSASDQDKISNNDSYILSIDLESTGSFNAETSNRLNLIIQASNYTKNSDIPGLLVFNQYKFLQHTEEIGVDPGKTSNSIWIEDGLLVEMDFDIVTDPDQLVSISKIQHHVIAFNPITNKSFIIQTVDVSSVVSAIQELGGNEVQIINTEETRAFLLPEDNQFNLVELKSTTFSFPNQKYELKLGIKIDWQDWKPLLEAFGVFFDETEPNNGLNKKTSNYSEKNNFEIRFRVDVTVNKSGIDTIYEGISPKSTVYSYDENSAYTVTINTEKLDTTSLLGNISNNENTILVTTYDDGSTKTDLSKFEAITRIEIVNDGGLGIVEISSLRGVLGNQLLIPLVNESNLKKEIIAGNFTTKCLIDFKKLTSTNYKISSRLHDVSGFVNLKRLSFDGINEFLNCGNDVSLQIGNNIAFTWSGWVELNNVGVTMIFMSKRIVQDGIIFYHSLASKKLNMFAIAGNPTDFTWLVGNQILTPGVKYHIALTKSSNDAKAADFRMYLNAVLQTPVVNSDTLTGEIANAGNFEIGATSGGSAPMDGFEDEMVVHNTELNAAEILELYNGGVPINPQSIPTSASLVSNWRCGEGGSIAVIPDQTGNNDGIPVNMDITNIVNVTYP